MTVGSVEVVDTLALLSTKVASNVFDLSSGMHHVSIRDQMVRAQLVVRDLCRGDANFRTLLVVGAGIAGVSAALEAVERDVKRVVVVDANCAPFDLLRGVHCRHVGPFMYEWPSTFSGDQSYPNHRATTWCGRVEAGLRWEAREPVSAHALAEMLTEDLGRKLSKLRSKRPSALTICIGVNKWRIQRFVRKFAQVEAARAVARLQRQVPMPAAMFEYSDELKWPCLSRANAHFAPDYVVLAAGMGRENTKLVARDSNGKPYHGHNFSGTRFWAQDELLFPKTAQQRVAVFGGGDGALQDALRALTGYEQPMQLMAFLEAAPAVQRALARVMPRLLDADRQSRQFGTWTIKHNEYRTLDATCGAIARELACNARIVRRVGQAIRQGAGEVAVFVRGDHFDKAYLLNRFVVHLIEACGHAQKTMWSGRMRLVVRRNHWASCYRTATMSGTHVVEVATSNAQGVVTTSLCYFDTIAVRYGISAGSVPGGQMIQVSDQMSLQRTSLSRVELPFVAEEG